MDRFLNGLRLLGGLKQGCYVSQYLLFVTKIIWIMLKNAIKGVLYSEIKYIDIKIKNIKQIGTDKKA